MKFDFDSKSFDLIFATANHLYKDSNCWITGIWRERNRHCGNFANLIFVFVTWTETSIKVFFHLSYQTFAHCARFHHLWRGTKYLASHFNCYDRLLSHGLQLLLIFCGSTSSSSRTSTSSDLPLINDKYIEASERSDTRKQNRLRLMESDCLCGC